MVKYQKIYLTNKATNFSINAFLVNNKIYGILINCLFQNNYNTNIGAIHIGRPVNG